MRHFAKGQHVKSTLSVRKDEIGALAKTFEAMQVEIEKTPGFLKSGTTAKRNDDCKYFPMI